MTSYHFDYRPHQDKLRALFKELEQTKPLTKRRLAKVVNKYPRRPGRIFTKSQLLIAYQALAGQVGLQPVDQRIVRALRKKPIRTASGVTPVTVLTKPFPCPGKCIFCPNDIRMPKSYLADEPGAQRAERNYFDPYLQTYNRLHALKSIGHNIDKVEIIVLGGTWSFYPLKYQIWFIKECFRALNEFGENDDRRQVEDHYQQLNQRLKEMRAHALSNNPQENEQALVNHQIDGEQLDKSYNRVVSEVYTAPEKLGGFDQYQAADWTQLEEQRQLNETAQHRCVGLVVETRPDNISPAEVVRIRRLGGTKTQLGVQSLQDDVLAKNHRGHDVAATRRAFKLLRQAGFKIHAHWMANLYGSNVERDKTDFQQLFDDIDFRPDELKIYPCSLLQSAELMQYYRAGQWRPYTHHQLLTVMAYALTHTPPYCRLTRVVRDIPSTEIVAGNKKTNFRQIAQQHLDQLGQSVVDIRAREIRRQPFKLDQVKLEKIKYQTSVGQEIFLQYVLPQTGRTDRVEQANRVELTKKTEPADQPAKILAFLRLSLPTEKPLIAELTDSALIREIHVYGQAVGIGQHRQQRPQHAGFGTKLIAAAAKLAQEAGYQQLAVISAIGTKEYYRKKGFVDGQLYQFKKLN